MTCIETWRHTPSKRSSSALNTKKCHILTIFPMKMQFQHTKMAKNMIFFGIRQQPHIVAISRIFKIQNPSIFMRVMVNLVRPEKLAKSNQISLEGCTLWLIAGKWLAEKKFCKWISYFQVTPMHPSKSNFILKIDPHGPNSI